MTNSLSRIAVRARRFPVQRHNNLRDVLAFEVQIVGANPARLIAQWSARSLLVVRSLNDFPCALGRMPVVPQIRQKVIIGETRSRKENPLGQLASVPG